MKRLSTFFACLAMLTFAAACQHEIDIQPESSPFINMTVDAGTAGTRTAVTVDGSTYNVKWKAGDKIAVAEVINANYNNPKGPTPVQRVESAALAADAAVASFNVTLANRTSDEENPYHDSFRYVGVYPASKLYSVQWTGDNRAEWEEHWGNTTTPDHTILMVEISTYQVPTADSFDPAADLLVSDMVVSATQPDNLSLHFARVGSIAKITLKGLPKGKTVKQGTFSFPQTWPGAYMMEYDPVLGKTGLFTKSSGEIYFQPDGVVVNDSGEAVIWLRTMSGNLSGWFKFDVRVDNGAGGDVERYVKLVDLDKLGRSISFVESKVTTFGVTLEKHYDITMNLDNFETTETSLTMDVIYNLGGMPHESVTYGLIRFPSDTPDPFESVKWETAAPADKIVLTPDGSGRATHSESGLTPDTDYCFMPCVVVDGVAFYPEYSWFTLHTLKHYVYATPDLVDLGLPSGTKWATFNLGSDDPLTAGYYFKWGEVRPTEDFNNSYYSKYWNQSYYSSTGYALKYSTVAANGLDDLMDMKTVLDEEDDAATVALGGEWRTPTSADFNELFENCTRSVLEGETGYVYTSKINGNSITFPACGYYSGSTKEDDTFMMTSSLAVDGISYHNNAWIAKIKWGQAEYTETNGATRGHLKYNVRPVKGGTRTGYTWTAHTSVTNIGSSSAIIHGEFLVEEDLANWQDYKYTTHIDTDPLGTFPSKEITRNGFYEYVGLTPGTTYYYYVYWQCKRYSNEYEAWVYQGGASEVRSFVAE